MYGAARVVGWTVFVALTALGLGVVYYMVRYPDVGKAPLIRVLGTAEQVQRGKHLANYVCVCISCHSERNWAFYSGPPVPGTEGAGGYRFAGGLGSQGVIYAKNITPAGIGSITDGELFRSITSGVRKNGNVLFPVMPYPEYNRLSDDDLYSIIAYIRTLKPVESTIPETRISFPMNQILKTIPSRHIPVQTPNPADVYGYGRYLTNAAVCIECHTKHLRGRIVKGMEFAGGVDFPFTEGVVRSANITPDEETGIGSWTKEVFFARFKSYASADSNQLRAAAMIRNSPMPWTMYAQMKGEELRAIFQYLRAVPRVKNKVQIFMPKAR